MSLTVLPAPSVFPWMWLSGEPWGAGGGLGVWTYSTHTHAHTRTKTNTQEYTHHWSANGA